MEALKERWNGSLRSYVGGMDMFSYVFSLDELHTSSRTSLRNRQIKEMTAGGDILFIPGS